MERTEPKERREVRVKELSGGRCGGGVLTSSDCLPFFSGLNQEDKGISTTSHLFTLYLLHRIEVVCVVVCNIAELRNEIPQKGGETTPWVNHIIIKIE